MPRVCLDTNVWLSGLVHRSGPPARIVDLALDKKFRLITSSVMLDELERNLTRKFEFKPREARDVRHQIVEIAELHEPRGEIQVIAEDHVDNLVLETAALGKARYLVTGDRKHLLPLGTFKMTKIVAPADFLPLVDDDH